MRILRPGLTFLDNWKYDDIHSTPSVMGHLDLFHSFFLEHFRIAENNDYCEPDNLPFQSDPFLESWTLLSG